MAILNTPIGYTRLSEHEKAKICNGCGSKGIGGWIVPDTILGLCVKEPCNIHDYGYSVGENNADKKKEDRRMLNNFIRVIEQDGKQWWWLVKWRKQRAYEYYLAVKHLGGAAFWEGKNEPETMIEVNNV